MSLQLKFSRQILRAVVLLAAFAAPLQAADPLIVRDAWVRAPVAGQPVVGAYLELESPASAALVAVQSPLAARVEMHTMTINGGVMKMRRLPRIDLPAGKPVKLAPGGMHLMMFGVKEALVAGARVPLALTVERADGGRATVRVDAQVRAETPVMRHKH